MLDGSAGQIKLGPVKCDADKSLEPATVQQGNQTNRENMTPARHWIHSLCRWGMAVAAAVLLFDARGASDAQPQTTNGLLHHSFRQTLVIEVLDGDGKVKETKTEVKEVAPINGRYLFGRVVSRDGKPLTPQEERAETRRLEKFQQAVREGRRPKGEDDSFDFVTDDFAGFREGATKEGFEVTKLTIESVRGRECQLLSFSSRTELSPASESPSLSAESASDARPPNTREKKEFEKEFLRSVEGRIWVDQEDREPAQLELRLARPFRLSWCMVNIKRFDLDVNFERLEPKMWLPVQANALIHIRAFLFLNYNMRVKLVRDQFTDVTAAVAGTK